jgi:ubiquinone/menaquinone biosynthesis C-methylase UbiE
MTEHESHDASRYYQDHWRSIEPERMQRYEAMFQWRAEMESLIAPANISPGLSVVDYGCGPGALSIELARRVTASGTVHAVDINPDFLEKTRAAGDAAGVAKQLHTVATDGDRIDIADHSVDRVICKNVLEYVPDPAVTIGEFKRVLAPGGIGHVIDSDWGALLAEPFGTELDRIMAAANIAFRTPLIGRKLYGLFRAAGFQDVRVQILANADTRGGMRPVLRNMATYARTSGELDDAVIDAFLAALDRATDDGTWLAVLPQFLVTGVA